MQNSPDAKHYTTLQPVGIGSHAAYVMKDLLRDGIVSVSAVSSTSSPELDNVTSTNDRFVFSTYSSNYKGKLI